jgi:hypothetical protein
LYFQNWIKAVNFVPRTNMKCCNIISEMSEMVSGCIFCQKIISSKSANVSWFMLHRTRYHVQSMGSRESLITVLWEWRKSENVTQQMPSGFTVYTTDINRTAYVNYMSNTVKQEWMYTWWESVSSLANLSIGGVLSSYRQRIRNLSDNNVYTLSRRLGHSYLCCTCAEEDNTQLQFMSSLPE